MLTISKMTKDALAVECKELRERVEALQGALDDANDYAAEQEHNAAHAEDSWGKHQEARMQEAADILADLGVIGPTPQAKYRWIHEGEHEC